MKGCFFVEPLVAIYAFSAFLIFPIAQQYVYRRLWEQLTNSSYPVSQNSSTCASNGSSNQSHIFEEVQREASIFSFYTEVFTAIPSLIVTLLLVTYSDRGGRKMALIPPLVGTLIYTLSFLTVSYFNLNIYFLIGFAVLSSLFGGLGTFLGGCFAYIADLSENDHQRTMRMTGVEVMIGLFSGGAAISTGFFLRNEGFNWPFFTAALFLVLNLFYAVFFLEETVKRPQTDGTAINEPPQRLSFKQIVFGAFCLLSGTSSKHKTVFILLISIFTTLSLANGGGLSVVTLYELNKPLCWSEILIGYGVALSTTVFLGSYLGVRALTYCGASQLVIVLIGILSVLSGMVLLAFTKTTLMMFLVRVPLLLSIMPFPVLRAMMSKIISKSKQGALFACVSFMQSITGTIASAMFYAIYASTVAWFPGFSFLLSAGLCAIPLSLLWVLCAIGVDVTEENPDPEPGSEQEENPVAYDDDSSPLLS